FRRVLFRSGMTVVFATLFSILASVTLTPMLCAYLLKDIHGLKGPFIKISGWLDNRLTSFMYWFKQPFDFMMRRPLISVLIVGAFFMSISYPAKRIGSEFIPRSDRDEFAVEIEMPDGTPVEKTIEAVRKIESHIKQYPEVVSYFS